MVLRKTPARRVQGVTIAAFGCESVWTVAAGDSRRAPFGAIKRPRLFKLTDFTGEFRWQEPCFAWIADRREIVSDTMRPILTAILYGLWIGGLTGLLSYYLL